MTLGEKIRLGRKSCGLSQEQLAEKMCVSRSAIAKWETGKGMPDIENLKHLSRLLSVSADELLDDKQPGESIIRRPCNLAAFGRGCKKVKRDRMIRAEFPDAVICTLSGRPDLNSGETVADNTRGLLTPAPFGVPEFVKSLKNPDRSFYLVDSNQDQFFVTVTDTYLEIRPVHPKQTDKAFRLGGWLFIRCELLPWE